MGEARRGNAFVVSMDFRSGLVTWTRAPRFPGVVDHRPRRNLSGDLSSACRLADNLVITQCENRIFWKDFWSAICRDHRRKLNDVTFLSLHRQ